MIGAAGNHSLYCFAREWLVVYIDPVIDAVENRPHGVKGEHWSRAVTVSGVCTGVQRSTKVIVHPSFVSDHKEGNFRLLAMQTGKRIFHKVHPLGKLVGVLSLLWLLFILLLL